MFIIINNINSNININKGLPPPVGDSRPSWENGIILSVLTRKIVYPSLLFSPPGGGGMYNIYSAIPIPTRIKVRATWVFHGIYDYGMFEVVNRMYDYGMH